MTNLVKNLIFRQFSKPILHALREVVSNHMDANQRANRPNEPLDIYLQHNCFRAGDRGDGINLMKFFVPGLSSNEKALIDLNQSLNGVTGRFGTGSLSAFFYLIYGSSPLFSILPDFKAGENGEVSLSLQVFLDGKPAEITFSASLLSVTHTIQMLDPKQVRKRLTIHSWEEGFDAIQMKFEEKQGEILFDIVTKPKETLGTAVKISSPIIGLHLEKIQNYIRDCFGFVPTTPLFLNGKQINQMDGYHKWNFNGFTLYASQSANDPKGGSIQILERGKLILSLPTGGGSVFSLMAISFDQLHLSQERESINFKDPNVIQAVQTIINVIWQQVKSDHSKAAFINSLYPLLIPERCDLLAHVKFLLFQSKRRAFLPNIKELYLWKGSKAAYLLPEYFDKLPLDLKEMGPFSILIASDPLPQPFLLFYFQTKPYVIIDHRIHQKDFLSFAFNSALLSKWLVLKLNSHISMSQFAKVFETQPLSSPPVKFTPTNTNELSCQYYEEMPDGNQMISVQEVVRASNEAKARLFIAPLPKKLLVCLCDLSQGRFLKEETRLLASYDCLNLFTAGFSQESSINTYLIAEIIQEIASAIQQINSQQITTSNLDVKCYAIFVEMSINRLIKGKQTISDIRMMYEKLKKLVDRSDYLTNWQKWVIEQPEMWRSHYTLDVHIRNLFCELSDQFYKNWDVYSKICEFTDDPSILSQLLQHLTALPNLSHVLNTYRESEIKSFVSLLPYRILRSSSCYSWNPETYDVIRSAILNLKSSDTIKQEWLAIYILIDKIQLLTNGLNCDFSVRQWVAHLPFLSQKFSTEEQVQELKEAVSSAMKVFSAISENISRARSIQQKKAFFSKHSPKLEILYRAVSTYFVSQDLKNRRQLEEALLVYWEELGIPDQARLLIYLVLINEETLFQSRDYAYPVLDRPFIPLHKDPSLIKWLKSENGAKSAILGALNQTVEEGFWIGEVVAKNPKEAGATLVEFETHLSPNQNSLDLVAIIKDNGSGPDPEALKVPNLSTKRYGTVKDPNQGLGFYSLFARSGFDECHALASRDGKTQQVLHFKKDQESPLLIAEKENVGTFSTGLTLILKKTGVQNPNLEMLQLKCLWIEKCKYFKGIDLRFNNTSLNQIGKMESLASYRDTYFHLGQKEGEISVQIHKGEGGIYVKDVRMGRMSSLYLSLLPPMIVKIINREGVKFSIFLPHIEQVRTRSHTIEDPVLLDQVRLIVLKAALRYLAVHHFFAICSADYWEFDQPNSILDPELKGLLTSVQLSKEPGTKTIEQIILDYAKTFLNSQTNLELPYTLNEGERAKADQFLIAIEQQNDIHELIDEAQALLQNEKQIRSLLVHMPLYDGGPTYQEIKEKLFLALREKELLEFDGEYAVIAIDEEELKNQIRPCLAKVFQMYPHQIVESVLEKFLTNICLHSVTRKDMQVVMENVNDTRQRAIKILQKFFINAAKHLWNQDIQVGEYAKDDGAIAYTIQGTTKIKINLLSSHLTKFMNLLESIEMINIKNLEEQEQLFKTHSTIIMEWIDTLLHEFVHVKEGSACSATHDEAFKLQLSQEFERLPILDANQQVKILELFFESLNENSN